MNRHFALLASAYLLLAAGGYSPGVRADDKPSATVNAQRSTDNKQDIVFLGETRPLFVRLHVLVDEKPLDVAWNGFIKGIFDTADTNKDGALNKEEVKKVPAPQLLFSSGIVANFTSPRFEQLDENRDGKVTQTELATYFKRNGGGPFQLTAGAPQMASPRPLLVNAGNSGSSSEAMNNALFTLLDTNKDGKLSRQELQTAPERLLTLDRNEDETVSAQEILPNSGQGQYRVVDAAAAVAVRRPAQPAIVLPAFLVEPGQPLRDVARRLQAKYGPKDAKQKDRHLSRHDLGLDETTFQKLDADGDGGLDSEELSRFTQRTPDIELTMRVGKYPGDAKPVINQTPDSQPLSDAIAMRRESALVSLGTTKVEIRATTRSGGAEVEINRKQFYEAQFSNADGDNNGYVDKTEAESNPLFNNAFALMDADGDGMVYKNEMFAFVTRMQDMQKLATASCASLAFSDQGRGLFDLLDTKKDNKLSLREMRQAAQSLAVLDTDGDGCISRTEVPRTYQLTLNRGNSGANQFPGVVAVALDGRSAPAAPPLPDGPLWFRKMDRNRDGDVSRREFLGTDEDFKRIDADNDGLISLQEAAQFDEQTRKKE